MESSENITLRNMIADRDQAIVKLRAENSELRTTLKHLESPAVKAAMRDDTTKVLVEFWAFLESKREQ